MVQLTDMATAHIQNVKNTIANLKKDEAAIQQEIQRLEAYLEECTRTLNDSLSEVEVTNE